MSKRQMRLGLFLQTVGHHIGGWRHPDAEVGGMNFDLIRRVTQTAEQAKFDMVFFADSLITYKEAHPSISVRFEPLTALSALAMVTDKIGLAATSSTTYGEPYHVARQFASLDHISGGRAAWNVVTTAYDRTAENFSRGPHPEHDERYSMASEFVQVVRGLWDTWEDDAFVYDKENGVYFDKNKQHDLNHQGQYYRCKGALNVDRPVQGHPIIIQAGASEPGQELAAETADVVFSAAHSLDQAQKYYRSLKGKMPKFGRDPNELFILPGLFPVVGRTVEEAKGKYRQMQEWMDTSNAIQMLSDRLGYDISGFPLDGPLPELPKSNQMQSRSVMLTEMARKENLTIRDLYYLVAGSRGHCTVWGTGETIADTLQEWFEHEGCDGFNLMPPYHPGGFEDFTREVVPVLQSRGLFRTEYEGKTLRDHLGLLRKPNLVHPSK